MCLSVSETLEPLTPASTTIAANEHSALDLPFDTPLAAVALNPPDYAQATIG